MMIDANQSFNFLPIPTDVHFGYGMLGTLPERIDSLGGRRVFIVTDPGIRSAGILDTVTRTLDAAAIEHAVYDHVHADSGSGLITEATEELKSCGADVVLGVGGGSSLDTAKAVAVMATNPGSPLDYVGVNRVSNRPLALIALPTTAGTGSEVSLWSVFTNDNNKQKVAIGGVLLYPTVALCDPELTLNLPSSLTASTGMDALAHAIECYTNNACQPISGALALRAIELIGCHLRVAVHNGRERASRYAMLLASTLAGMAMNPTRLGLAHALAMPLGSRELKIPHSIVLAVTLPVVMDFNYLAAPDRFVDVARALGEPLDGLSSLAAARQASRAVADLASDSGIPKGLSEYGLREDHIPDVVEEAMKSGNVAVNPRRTSKEELAEILRRAI